MLATYTVHRKSLNFTGPTAPRDLYKLDGSPLYSRACISCLLYVYLKLVMSKYFPERLFRFCYV